MFRTFIFGIFLGIVATAGALYAIPAVDQHRESSIVTVIPNGGNTESFHINMPMDRIMAGSQGQHEPLPAGMEWPTDALLVNVSMELFKIRNARDTVVGVAARTAAKDDETNLIDWVLHLPARGSFFISMSPVAMQGNYRIGVFSAGTREFAELKGTMTERWVADTSGEEDAPEGRIKLFAQYVGAAVPVDSDAAEPVE